MFHPATLYVRTDEKKKCLEGEREKTSYSSTDMERAGILCIYFAERVCSALLDFNKNLLRSANKRQEIQGEIIMTITQTLN